MRTIDIVAYDPAWPAMFQAERRHLRQALGDSACHIHHIGSTAVAGLAAKPIIDILLEVTGLASLDEDQSAMEEIGYECMGEFGIPGRRYFRKGGENRSHHIHAFARGDSNIARHLAFRDYLRKHADVAAEYAQLKMRLARECDNDIGRYCQGKDLYVKRVERLAMQDTAGQTHCSQEQ